MTYHRCVIMSYTVGWQHSTLETAYLSETTNKNGRHDIAEILLKVVITITLTLTLTLLGHISSPVLSGAHVTQSLVFCVVFCVHCLPFVCLKKKPQEKRR